MKTAISVTDIERQLIHQLSSFFKVSNEEVELINVKIGIISRCDIAFPVQITNTIRVREKHILILINRLNTPSFYIIFPIQYTMKRQLACWQINFII